MTKAELIDALVNRADGLTKKQAPEIVEVVFQSMKSTLEGGENLERVNAAMGSPNVPFP